MIRANLMVALGGGLDSLTLLSNSRQVMACD